MAGPVLILHGWSDTSDSFRPLASFLSQQGFEIAELWLGDYLSLEDDVRVEDVARLMRRLLSARLADGSLQAPFDLIVHSTGGLVARQWLVDLARDGEPLPCRRLLMLAPANFGSRLARQGKSLIGRAYKGWRNGFQTGRQMLDALELASAFQWQLAGHDLFGEGPSLYGFGDGKVAPFIIVGTHPYDTWPRSLVDEAGADGTVRAAAANLNAYGMTIRFAAGNPVPQMSEWPRLQGEMRFPCAVLAPHDHATITNPSVRGHLEEGVGDPLPLEKFVLEALTCSSAAQYEDIERYWGANVSEFTASLAHDDGARNRLLGKADPAWFHQYFQMVVRVEDDYGRPIPDYFLEFQPEDTENTAASDYFHAQVLEKVDVNSHDPGARCLFIDRTDLMDGFYGRYGARGLFVTLTIAPEGPNVGYFDEVERQAVGRIPIHGLEASERWLRRNSTHFVRIIVPRVPGPSVFRMAQYNGALP
ncbi:esterase/lipase family protein [Radicibacter daui]|uniref:esterase/lipase family protein n=1 Tax=Radicibacter daui TaxID=3064829 RepID=UPI004046ED45